MLTESVLKMVSMFVVLSLADAFVCAGVCTFSGQTTFASITFSELTVGVGTVTGRIDVQNDANFSGVTTARGLIIGDAFRR